MSEKIGNSWILHRFFKLILFLFVTTLCIKFFCVYSPDSNTKFAVEQPEEKNTKKPELNPNKYIKPSVRVFVDCPKSASKKHQPIGFLPKNYSSLLSHPNLPLFYLKESLLSLNIPNAESIRWSGIHWQESWRKYPKFLLYSAHFDDRATNGGQYKDKYFVRILSLFDGKKLPSKYSCLLYFDPSESPVMTPVYSYDLIDSKQFSPNRLNPFLISCQLPPMEDKVKFPVAVSLANNSCTSPSNVLKVTGVIHNKEDSSEKKVMENNTNIKKNVSIAICGPALYYYSEDFSHRLVEWIEIMYLIGASKVILYKTVNHKNVEKVLDYYEQQGKVKIVSFHYPPPYVDEPLIRKSWSKVNRNKIFTLENIYFTDCILRFKDDFDFIAHFDPDEVPILKKHKSLPELINSIKQTEDHTPAFYFLAWRAFYPDIPFKSKVFNASNLFYMLSHNRYPKRVPNGVENNGKSIYDTSKVLSVYSHKPFHFVDRSSKMNLSNEGKIPPSVAYTAHFRDLSCGSKCKKDDYLEEDFLMKKKDQIINNVNSILDTLELR